MKKTYLSSVLMAGVALLFPQNTDALELMVKTPVGDEVYLEVQLDDTIGEILDQVGVLSCEVESQQWVVMDFLRSQNEDDELVCKVKPKDYYIPVTDAEAKDISYIVCTLGNEPVVKLKKYEASLQSAGDRLIDVHPLNVWKIIFTDKKNISAMHNIKSRKLVWKSFTKGMGKSLQESYDLNNLKLEYIHNFAEAVGINANLILPSLQSQDWENFIKVLLANISRDGNPGRYGQ